MMGDMYFSDFWKMTVISCGIARGPWCSAKEPYRSAKDIFRSAIDARMIHVARGIQCGMIQIDIRPQCCIYDTEYKKAPHEAGLKK